jgi:asparagine synthase (glutamine-hydrolysing)
MGFDERRYSEALANLFKTEHYECVLHAGDMEHVLPRLVWHLEDLRVGQSYPNYYVARLASKFVKVVLSGVGGDELFGGYPWRYFRHAGSDPETYFRGYYDFWQRLVSDGEKEALFTAEVWRDVRELSTYDLFRDVFRGGEHQPRGVEEAVDASLYFELKTFLNGLLIVEDKLSMAHSLETRAPFLDNDLVDFALRIPATYKLRDLASASRVDESEFGKRRRVELQTDEGKRILRRVAERFVPRDVATRAKQGFSAPDASWFRGESIEYVKTTLLDRNARIFDHLRYDFVKRKIDEHTSGARNNRLFIWSLLSFEWWLRTFLP